MPRAGAPPIPRIGPIETRQYRIQVACRTKELTSSRAVVRVNHVDDFLMTCGDCGLIRSARAWGALSVIW